MLSKSWNRSSHLKLFYNVFCYIVRYSSTLISLKIIHHLGGQAHKIAVELERVKPNNEKAVLKKALPSTLNKPRIDHVCDKNMREGYIKLFRTAHTIAKEPTLPLNQFKTLATVQKENNIQLIQVSINCYCTNLEGVKLQFIPNGLCNSVEYIYRSWYKSCGTPFQITGHQRFLRFQIH